VTLPRLPLTLALGSLLSLASGHPCGIGELPRVRDQSGAWRPAEAPYLILDSMPSEFTGPPMADWHADAAWSFQVTSVAERGDQALWLADRVRHGLVGRDASGWAHPLQVPGMTVVDRELEYDAAGETTVSARGSIVSYVQRVTVTVTPA
jgi:hypothetical protein